MKHRRRVGLVSTSAFQRSKSKLRRCISVVSNTRLPFTELVKANVSHPGIAGSLRYIANNYDRPIKVLELGKIAGMSRRGYHKAFQRHIGLRPAELLRHLRIERAKRLLIESDLLLPQVAIQCGYSRSNSFWVAFRQTTGVAPGQFKRKARLVNRHVSV